AEDMSGDYSVGNASRATVWDGLTPTTPNRSSAYVGYGVNEQGVAVGYQTGFTSDDAILFKNGVTTVLPKGIYTYAHAQRINSAETIVGWVGNSPNSANTYPAVWKSGVLTVLST